MTKLVVCEWAGAVSQTCPENAEIANVLPMYQPTDQPTDQPTYQPTNRPTDIVIVSYKVTFAWLGKKIFIDASKKSRQSSEWTHLFANLAPWSDMRMRRELSKRPSFWSFSRNSFVIRSNAEAGLLSLWQLSPYQKNVLCGWETARW